MDVALAKRADEIVTFAREKGWEAEVTADRIEGDEAVQITATRNDHHPDDPGVGLMFGFTMAFVRSAETNRISAACFDGKPHARVVVIEDGHPDTYWAGPVRSWKEALEDPQSWTEVPYPEFVAS